MTEAFEWKKLGQIFDLKQHSNMDWMREQAQNPFLVDMGDVLRVYFNTRALKDENGLSKSLAGFVDFDKSGNFEVVRVSEKPIFEHGGLGEFDEFGIMAGSVAKMEDAYWLYYVGWTRKVSVPYDWQIGLAKSTDNGDTFKRFGRGSIIGSTNTEPFLQAGCSSIMNLNGVWHLWYTSGIKWIQTDHKPESVYQIMHATSKDGINWEREGVPVISPVIKDEAQASPSVIFHNNKYHMVFSYRHSTDFRNKERGYRIGYAWSEDLKNWHRDDVMANINVSDDGWDSEMVCYPHLSKIGNDVYLFYCGNDFGKFGFGVAKLIK